MDVTAEFPSEERQSIDRVRLRLADLLGDLRPLSTPDEFRQRLRAVLLELESIRNELELVFHLSQAEQVGLSDALNDIDHKLAQGWKPEASPVEDLVDRLRPFAQR